MIIGKLPGKLPGKPLSGCSTSPRSPKSFDLGGVGLAIVAALEKNCDNPAGKVVCSRNSRPSAPIPVTPSRNPARFAGNFAGDDEEEEEEYTVVTCRGGGAKPFTRVYRDNGEVTAAAAAARGNRRSVFVISPASFVESPAYPDSDFLSSCNLCRKKLSGKDIYMYRGETAFCSTECRYRQIVMDERKEKCSSEISRSVDISTSLCNNNNNNNGQMFSTGILAL